MILHWAKDADDTWHSLEWLDLAGVHESGVYVIWKPNSDWGRLEPPRTIAVGRGNVALRLAAHRMDRGFMSHGPRLLVTWAAVSPDHLDGVYRYLAETLHPVLHWDLPQAEPIPVNPPIAA